MSRGRALVACGALVPAVVATAPGAGAGGGDPTARWAALLARIPGGPTYRASVVLNDFDAARDALGLDAHSGSATARRSAFAELARAQG
jgi:hypothetical protein